MSDSTLSSHVLKQLGIMAAMYQRGLIEKDVVKTYAEDLAAYPEQQVLNALSRCRRELKTFPTIADVISRIEDGRPGAEEAWAMIPKDESASVVWTDEMRDAFAIARELLADDPVAARMAFREAYLRLVSEGRARHRPTRWTPSLGHDSAGRAQALQIAVDRNRISHEAAEGLLPDYTRPARDLPQLTGPGGERLSASGIRSIKEIIINNAPEDVRKREIARDKLDDAQKGPLTGEALIKDLEKTKQMKAEALLRLKSREEKGA